MSMKHPPRVGHNPEDETMTYTKCSVLNLAVEFKLVPTSGYISVVVDGIRIGNYPTVRLAMFEAAEYVRIIENQSIRPSIPEETWAAVEQWATLNG